MRCDEEMGRETSVGVRPSALDHLPVGRSVGRIVFNRCVMLFHVVSADKCTLSVGCSLHLVRCPALDRQPFVGPQLPRGAHT